MRFIRDFLFEKISTEVHSLVIIPKRPANEQRAVLVQSLKPPSVGFALAVLLSENNGGENIVITISKGSCE